MHNNTVIEKGTTFFNIDLVPTDIKRSVDAYISAQNVITFEEFFRDHIDPAISRWSAKRVI